MSSDSDSIRERHLDWSAKQGRILTCNGRANELYTKERGFSFDETELPHYHLLAGDASFSHFAASTQQSPVHGAWSRAYFVGGWEFSSERDETVYNVQTYTLFIDLRIPTTRTQLLPASATCLEDYTNEELRCYARQHVFAGYTSCTSKDSRPVCLRHHCLDWNFVGLARPRPNKWFVEFNYDNTKWKEWAYATNEYGQHYYCEQWERLPQASGQTLVLRKASAGSNDDDGVLVIVGNHFNYIRGSALVQKNRSEASSLVELVDTALTKGDRETALQWLGRIEAGHGRTNDWIVDAAIQPWKEGVRLFDSDELVVSGEDLETCQVFWNGERWNVFETDLCDLKQLKKLFYCKD